MHHFTSDAGASAGAEAGSASVDFDTSAASALKASLGESSVYECRMSKKRCLVNPCGETYDSLAECSLNLSDKDGGSLIILHDLRLCNLRPYVGLSTSGKSAASYLG